MAIKNTNYGGTDWIAGAILTAADLNATFDAGFDQNLQKAGGTCTGQIIMQGAGITIPTGQDITLTDQPGADTNAANKAYVDAQVSAVSSPVANTGEVAIESGTYTGGSGWTQTGSTVAVTVAASKPVLIIANVVVQVSGSGDAAMRAYVDGSATGEHGYIDVDGSTNQDYFTFSLSAIYSGTAGSKTFGVGFNGSYNMTIIEGSLTVVAFN